jgi:hypothetical protein
MATKRTKFAKFAGVVPVKRAKRISDSGTVVMSLEEYAQADYAVEQALKFGNYGPLFERLRTPGAKHPWELSVTADIGEGKIKRPRHRIPQDPRVLRSKRWYLALCVRVAMDQGKPLKAAVADVAKEHSVGRAKIYAAVQENPDLLMAARPGKSRLPWTET